MKDEQIALLEAWLDDSITIGQAEELLAALRNDPEFRGEFAAALRTTGLLRAAAAPDRDCSELARRVDIAVGSGRDSRRFESRVMQALERQEEEPEPARSTPRRRRPVRRDSPWASPGRLIFMAAGVIIAVFTALTLFDSEPPPPPPETLPPVAIEKNPAPVKEIQPPVPAPPRRPDATARKPEPSPPSKAAPPPTPATLPRKEREDVEAEMRRKIDERRKQLARPERPAEKPKPSGVTETRFAVLQGVSGRVEAVRGGVGTPASNGHSISAGDGVRTIGVESRATLEFPDGTRVALEGSTTFREIRQKEGKRVVLDRGTLVASVAKQPQGRPMVFRTPHGEATVLGTTLKLTVVPGLGGSTRLEVTEGQVRLTRTANRRSVDVVAGHYALLAPGTTFASTSIRARTGVLWIRANAPDALFQAPMTRGKLYASDSLTGQPIFSAESKRPLNTKPTWNFVADGNEGGWVTYTIDIPQDGTWYLWGRMYHPGSNFLKRPSPQVGYPENDPNSFYVRIDGAREKIFGNLMYDSASKRSAYRRWHWHGNGAVEVGKPAPLNLGILRKGRHTLRIRDRDAVERPNLRLAPRLDVLCVTRDAEYVPSDEDARQGMR